MSFTGRFYGECGSCGEQTKDTEVEYDGTSTLVHVVCPTVAPEVVRPPCPRCFVELPVSGVCGFCE